MLVSPEELEVYKKICRALKKEVPAASAQPAIILLGALTLCGLPRGVTSEYAIQDGVDDFPIELAYLAALRKRVQLAVEIDKCERRAAKAGSAPSA